jgi:hypothetical protein
MRSKTDGGLREREEVTGATNAAEVRRMREVINRHKRPDGVLTWNAEYGENSIGEPAVWVWFHFKDQPGLSQDKIDELTDFVHFVRADLLKAKIGGWPYVGFRNPPT